MLVWEEDRHPTGALQEAARRVVTCLAGFGEQVSLEVVPPAHACLMIDCPPRQLAKLHSSSAAAPTLKACVRYRHVPKGRYDVPNRERSQAPPRYLR